MSRKKPPDFPGGLNILPAASYSPTPARGQYHPAFGGIFVHLTMNSDRDNGLREGKVQNLCFFGWGARLPTPRFAGSADMLPTYKISLKKSLPITQEAFD